MKQFLFFIIIVSSFQFICAGGGDPAYYMYQELQKIDKGLDKNPQESAIKLDRIIKNCIDLELPHATKYAYNLMGVAYRELEQPKIALHYFKLGALEISTKKILKKEKRPLLYPVFKPSRYYHELAQVHAQLKDYKTSNSFYEKYKNTSSSGAVKLQADYKIGQNYYALEAYDKAISGFEKILATPDLSWNQAQINECHSFLAAAYISVGEIDKGMASYKNATLRFSEEDVIEIQEIEYEKSAVISKNKEVVSKALRKQNKFDEDLSLRNSIISINEKTNASLEYLRIAQTYYQTKNIAKAEEAIDQYLQNKSYDVIDASEIEVIKNVAQDLNNKTQPQKAYWYLENYNELKDSIDQRIKKLRLLSQEIGLKGTQNILELEIIQKDKALAQNTINHLLTESNLQAQVMGFQKKIIYGLIVLVLLSVLVFFYILRVSKQRRVANQKLALRSLRTQMNPHFIFNALNSVNSFISLNDDRSANKFLSEFSVLMRSVMENSEHDFIPLSKEIEILKIYTALEHFRFKDKFSYEFKVDETLDIDFCAVPPMMIQPYIENAIWHGLRYLKTPGTLYIEFKDHPKNLQVIVKDNGIGRTQSAALKTKNQKKNKSTALRNINERLKLLKSLHQLDVKVTVTDVYANGEGTLVTILIPKTPYVN